jgi:hypothetical protein
VPVIVLIAVMVAALTADGVVFLALLLLRVARGAPSLSRRSSPRWSMPHAGSRAPVNHAKRRLRLVDPT